MKLSVFTSLLSTFLWIFTVGHCLVEWQHCALSPLPELPGHNHSEHHEEPQPSNCEIQSTRPAASLTQSEQSQEEVARVTAAIVRHSIVSVRDDGIISGRQESEAIVIPNRLLRSFVAPNAPPRA